MQRLLIYIKLSFFQLYPIHMKKILLSISLLLFVSFSLRAQVSKPPVYKGCEESALNDLEACFNDKLKADILDEFKVPSIVEEAGYKGRINIVFVVTKEGKFEVLYVNAMYPELETEVRATITFTLKATSFRTIR